MNKSTNTSGPTGLARVRSLLTFRHGNPVARLISTLLAIAIAMLLVVGTSPAYAEDEPAAETTATSDAPSDPPADEPAEEPAEEPAAPAQEEPEAPAVEESIDDAGDESSDAPAPVLTKASGPTTNLVANVVGLLAADPDWIWQGSAPTLEDGENDTGGYTNGAAEDTNPAGWNGGNQAQNKADIVQYYFDLDTTGDIIASFGFTRAAVNGSTTYVAEFNQASNSAPGPVGAPRPNRTTDDLMLWFVQDGNNPLTFAKAFLWKPASGFAAHIAAFPGETCTAVTGTSAGWCSIPTAGFQGRTADDGHTGEGRVNLTELYGDAGCSAVFHQVNLRSNSSSASFTAAMQDYVTPIGQTVPSTCATLVIKKQAAGTTTLLTGAHFDVYAGPTATGIPVIADVYDGKAGVDTDAVVGQITLTGIEPGEYTVKETQAPPGYLLPATRTQTATALKSATLTFTFNDPKEWKALTAEKTAATSYRAVYAWSLEKWVSETGDDPWVESIDKVVPAGGSNTLFYKVTVTQAPVVKSLYKVTGTIKVGNTNDQAVAAQISDVLPGATCTVEGDAVHSDDVAAGGEYYDYECIGQPDALKGDNTAHVKWDKATYPQTQDQADLIDTGLNDLPATADYDFAEATVDSVNKDVTITDDPFTIDPAWTMSGVEAGQTQTRYYDVDVTVPPGDCSGEIQNTATVSSGATALDSDDAFGEVCEAAGLTIEDVDAETLTRTYPWSIEKATTTPEIRVVDGKAIADYDVTVTAGGGVDSAWNISGTITVANPNDWQAVDVTGVTVDYTGAADEVCTIDPNDPLTIPASDDQAYTYSCNFPSEPNLSGTITATVNWDGASAGTTDSSADSNVVIDDADWSKTLVNDQVTVVDDNATPGDTSDDTEWVLDWADVYAMTDHLTVLSYSIELTDLPELGTCATYTNTVKVVGDEGVILDADGDAQNNSADVEVCNPFAQISALKVDFETQEPLAGAEFELYDGDTLLGSATSGDDGIAVFDAKLVEGTYTVKETSAPEGYGLPINEEGAVEVTITADDLNNEVLAPVTFRDPGTGEIATLPKAQFERDALGVNWEPSDGVVDFTDEIRYVIEVESTGTRQFYDVTLTDYVPGYNPADVTTAPAGTKADLVVDSIACGGGITCTSEVDLATGLITWHLTEIGEADGVFDGAASGWVEFVVRMPDIPGTSPIQDPGTAFAAALWNQAYLDWEQMDFTQEEPSLAAAHLDSNEVVVAASATLPPEVVPPTPPVVSPPNAPGLPNTGGPNSWLLMAALVLILGGGMLVAGDRRRKRRS